MLKPIPSKPGLFSVAFKRFSRLRGIAVVTLMTLTLSVLYLSLVTPSTVLATPNATLNFQARLESSSGAIAPDGTYNVEFKLYSASSGGSAEWTEDYLVSATQGVKVANGYLTANLGSITAFPNTINWGTPQYLTMNIGSTTSCSPFSSCSPDGEMSPRLPLTAVPAAFSLESNINASGYNSNLTLTQPGSGVTTGNENFVVQDQGAAGTYSLLTGGSISGATAGVVLQSSSPGTVQTGNFNISATGLLATLDATGSGSANTLTIGAGDVATGSINIGGSSTTGTVTLGNTSETGAITLQVEGLNQILTGSATAPSDIVKTTTNAVSAFAVQSSSATVLDVDTSHGYVGIGTATPSTLLDIETSTSTITTSQVALNQSGSGDTSIQLQTAAQPWYLGVSSANSSNFTITSANADKTSSNFGDTTAETNQDNSGTGYQLCSEYTSGGSGAETVSSMSVYIGSASDVSPNNLYQVAIYSNVSSKPGSLIGHSNSAAVVGNSWNTVTINASITGGTLYWLCYQKNASSGSLSEITRNLTGTGAYNTAGGQTFGTWGSTFPSASTDFDGYAMFATYSVNGSYNTFGSSLMSMSSIGQTTFQNSTNTTNALQVQKSGGTSTVLDVDTLDGNVGIGTASPTRTLDAAVNNTQVAAPMTLLEQDGTGDSSMEFKDPNDSIYVGQDADGSDAFVVSSSIAASHNRAGSPYDLGYTSITDSFNDSGNSGLITSMPFTTSLGGTTNQVTVDFSTGAGDNFEVAIYADSGSNYPGALLATSPSTAITGTNGSNNWDTATLSTTVSLNPSTKYWLAYETQNGSANYWLDTTKGATCWQTNSGSFGTWVPTNTTLCDQSYTVNNTYGIYALVNPVGSSHSITDTFSNPLLTMSQSGFTTYEGLSNSTTAFQVDNSSASAVLDVDTVNSQVGIGTSAPSTALQVAVNNTTTNNLPLSLQQTGTGNTGLQFTTTSGSIYEGEDTDGTYRISSSTAAGSNSSILGYSAVGTVNENNDLGLLLANQFVATSTGTITTLNTYVNTVGSGTTNHGEMALYSDSGGSPHTLLANSSSTVLTANSWNSFTISSTSVTAGTNYWLVFETDSNTTGFANTTTNAQYPAVNETHTYSSALPTTWSTTASAYGNEGSMYASILSSSSGTDSLSSGGNNVATLGKTSGTATDTGDGSNINCSQFTPSVGGTTNYITVALGTTSSSGISYSFGIYTGTSTVPQTKVATSSTGTLNTVQGLQSLPISTTLTAGTLYWLCANSSAASGASSDYTYNPTDGVPSWFISRTFGSGWPATMGTGTTAAGSIDISVNYTITTSTNGLLKMTSTGQTTLQNVSNSINAFQIQDSSGGTAFNVDTADDFVGVGTSTPHAQLEVSGDAYLGTQALTANDQADVCLFGNSSCTAAQSGAFNNQLKIFGGSGSANDLFLYQAAGGNAYVGSSTANLVIETTSSNANILLEPNGSGLVISDTIAAFNPNSAGNAEIWHRLGSLPSGWSGHFAYKLLPTNFVAIDISITIASGTVVTHGTSIGTLPSGYYSSSWGASKCVGPTLDENSGNWITGPFCVSSSGGINWEGPGGTTSANWVINGNGEYPLDE